MAADIAVAIADGDAQIRSGSATATVVADSSRNVGGNDDRGFFEVSDLIVAGKTSDVAALGGLTIGKHVQLRLSGAGVNDFASYQIVDYAEDSAGWSASLKRLGASPAGKDF